MNPTILGLHATDFGNLKHQISYGFLTCRLCGGKREKECAGRRTTHEGYPFNFKR